MNQFKREAYNKGFKEFVDNYCTTHDFPIKGVNFIDIFPILESCQMEDLRGVGVPTEPIILLPEARGFLFYHVLGPERCIPLRKKGKLPGEVLTIPYKKEYGEDSLSVQVEAIRRQLNNLVWDKSVPVPICFFDDILATGGTAKAIIKYFNKLMLDGYTFKVTTAYFYIELQALNGRHVLEHEFDDLNVESVYEY